MLTGRSNTQLEESKQAELPFEIWSIVLSDLFVDSLRNIALTSRSFRSLAQVYLYKAVTITAEPRFEDPWRPTKKGEPEALLKVYPRIEFFSSTKIAPEVRACTLHCHLWQAQLLERFREAFCSLLSRFKNLRSLKLDGVLINPQLLTEVANLPSLQHLTLNDCKLDAVTRGDYRISTAQLSIHSRDRNVSETWFSVIDHQALTSLHLSATRSTLDVLQEIVLSEIQLLSLTELHIDSEDDVLTSRFLPLVFPKLPKVEALHFLPRKKEEVSFVPPITPLALTTYEGPHYMLPLLFEDEQPLRRVRLFGNRWEGTCDLIGILDDLRFLRQCAPHLEALRMQIFPTATACDAISSYFPTLKSLCFFLPLPSQSVLDPMYGLTRQPFFRAVLKMGLPSQLQHLVIYMISHNPFEGNEVIETLTRNYPSLKNLYLHFPRDYWMNWIWTPPPGGQEHDQRGVGVHRGLISSGYLNVTYDWF